MGQQAATLIEAAVRLRPLGNIALFGLYSEADMGDMPSAPDFVRQRGYKKAFSNFLIGINIYAPFFVFLSFKIRSKLSKNQNDSNKICSFES